MERLFWISMDHATFGIVSRNGIVEDAAPIAAWMIGQSLAQIRPWLVKKGAKVVECGIKSA